MKNACSSSNGKKKKILRLGTFERTTNRIICKLSLIFFFRLNSPVVEVNVPTVMCVCAFYFFIHRRMITYATHENDEKSIHTHEHGQRSAVSANFEPFRF